VYTDDINLNNNQRNATHLTTHDSLTTNKTIDHKPFTTHPNNPKIQATPSQAKLESFRQKLSYKSFAINSSKIKGSVL
jgi:hypothetical protein